MADLRVFGLLFFCFVNGWLFFSLGNAIAINIMLNIEGLNFIRLE